MKLYRNLTFRTWSAAIAFNYSIEDIRKDIIRKTLIWASLSEPHSSIWWFCVSVCACLQGITHMCQPSECGIWEELKSNCVAQLGSCVQLLLRSAFDVFVLSHNSDSKSVSRWPKSIVILLFTVVICALHSCCLCCHALNSGFLFFGRNATKNTGV